MTAAEAFRAWLEWQARSADAQSLVTLLLYCLILASALVAAARLCLAVHCLIRPHCYPKCLLQGGSAAESPYNSKATVAPSTRSLVGPEATWQARRACDVAATGIALTHGSYCEQVVAVRVGSAA